MELDLPQSRQGAKGFHSCSLRLRRISLRPTDTQLWERGKSAGLIIATKDNDFYDRALILGDHCKFYISRLGIAAIYNYFKSHLRVERDSLLSGSRLISIAHEKIEVFSLGREWSDIAC